MTKKSPKIKKAFTRVISDETPRAAFDVDFGSKVPVWQIGRIDYDGKWGWKNIGKDRWENDILPKLKNFESMTWSEIEKASGGKKNGNNSHFVPVEKIIPEAKKRLKEIFNEDIDDLFSLRLAGKTRLYGHRVGNIYKILWFDFEHEVCPSHK